MKKLLYVLAAVLLLSCSREENVLSGISPIEPKVYHVNFAFTGEVENDVDISREPLSKADEADTNDIYIINVYHKPPLESGYSQYAYGVFDRLENMSLNLYEGTLYQFQVTLVKDGRHKLKFFYDNTFHWYNDNRNTKVENKFILGGWVQGDYGAIEDYIHVKINEEEEKRCNHPDLNRYFGMLTDYMPTADETIAMDLYQMVFGVKINVTGLTHGSLHFNLNNIPREVVIRADSLYTPDLMFQMKGFGEILSNINTGTTPVNEENTMISWQDETGTRSVKIMDKKIYYTRQERTIFNIALREGAVYPTGTNFILEEEVMKDGEVHEASAQISNSAQ